MRVVTEGAKGAVVGPVLVDEEATPQTTQGRSPWGPALSLVLLRRAEDTRFELVRV